MRKIAKPALMLLLVLGTVPLVVGCEETVSKTEETRTRSDGSTVTETETVKKDSEGGVKTEKSYEKTPATQPSP